MATLAENQARSLPKTRVELEALLRRIEEYLVAGDSAIVASLTRANQLELFLEARDAGVKDWELEPPGKPQYVPFAPDIFEYMPARLREHLRDKDRESKEILQREQLAWCVAYDRADSELERVALLRDDVTLRRRVAAWLAECLAAFRGLRDMVLKKLGELETASSAKHDGERKNKKGTAPGDARDATESAFLAHHRYTPGHVGNFEPIDRAKLVAVSSKGYPTGFFKNHFGNGGYRTYKAICRKEAPKLEQVLRELFDGQRLRGQGRTHDAAKQLPAIGHAGDDSEGDE